MSMPKNIEKVKSALLVVLLLSTILLLYFFWENTSYNKISVHEDEINTEIPLSRDVTKPSKIIVSFGAGNYTVIPLKESNVWDSNLSDEVSIIKEFNKFGQSENILVEEITEAQFIEIMKFKSILAEFSYFIPFENFCEEYQIKKTQSYDVIENISSIGYSAESPDSLFIYDEKNKKYFRLVADSDHTDFLGLITSIEDKGYAPYYPLSVYLGVDNSILIPLDIETSMRNFYFRQDSYMHQVDKINEMAESFFGESFDFVRKITEDNGTIIYMYGYGQKVLIVNTDGSFEYKEELISESSAQLKYFDALDIALKFVSTHGSWESLDGVKVTPYIKDVDIDSSKKGSIKFTFGMDVNGVPLFYENGESIIVEVTLGQVTYYKRDMIDYDQEELDSIEAMSSQVGFSAVNMIAQNYEYIYKIISENKDGRINKDKNIIFEEVASLISNIQIGYFKPIVTNTINNQVRPVWIVTIEEYNIYFDLFNAEPVGYSQK